MAVDWVWSALSALAALGTLVFTGFLYRVSRRQASISAEQAAVSRRQADIAARQTEIQQAQHELQVQQDAARKPVLEVYSITVARWEAGTLWFNAEVANAGGSQVAPNAVLLRWRRMDGGQDGQFGRLHRARRSNGEGNLLLPGDVTTFACTVQLAAAPSMTPDSATLTIVAVDGTQSIQVPFRFP